MLMKNSFTIHGQSIQEYGRVFIIAEAGVNHNGNLDLALKLVDIAAEAGADAVKFQTFHAEDVVRKSAAMAAYQQINVDRLIDQQLMLRELELPKNFYPSIIKRCQEKNIMFFSTPHGGRPAVKLLENIGVEAYKLGSGDLTNYVLLKVVAETKKPMIISTGMATLREVKDAVSFIHKQGNDKIAVLHCTTNYPCPSEEVNLQAMVTLMKELNVPVGYSDHTEGVTVAVMAVTLGAAVYECHFTIDKTLPGPDHKASADPQELAARISAIRSVPVIMGSGVKEPRASEINGMIPLVRKSIVATNNLPGGHVITFMDLDATRPGDGIHPNLYKSVLGKRLKRPVSKGGLILKDSLQ